MRHPMVFFSIITLTAPALIALGAVLGGGWVLLGLLWMTGLAAVLDEVIALTLPTEEDSAEFPKADALSVALAVAQLALIALVVVRLGGDGLGFWEKLALFAAAGLFAGQVGNSNAHELIHRSSRRLHRLGVWVYISVLYGHHASAHVLVHHVHVGTKADPNSARWGEGLYRFVARAWPGEFRAGWAVETARLRRANRPAWRHPFVIYGIGAVLMLALAVRLGGLSGLIWYLALAGFAQFQLFLSDYVQHYGLRRQIQTDGKPEPVQPHHSWNSRHWFTSSLMLNAPRHSDHHAHPGRPYPALRLTGNMPMLPRSLPVMAVLALFPGPWKRVMNPLADRWQGPADRG